MGPVSVNLLVQYIGERKTSTKGIEPANSPLTRGKSYNPSEDRRNPPFEYLDIYLAYPIRIWSNIRALCCLFSTSNIMSLSVFPGPIGHRSNPMAPFGIVEPV